MRAVQLAVVLVLAVGLTACSSPAHPADLRTTGAPTAESVGSGNPEGAADLPAPPGILPAPEQRTPGPAAAGAGAAAGSAAPSPTAAGTPEHTPPSAPAMDEHADPASVDVVVNKRRPLVPVDFAPSGLRQPDVATATDNGLLRPDTATAVEEMFAAASADGVGLVLVSGYRSYANQESTYAYWVGQYGDQAGADTVSARPGHSEHQTGLAFDIGQSDGVCTLVSCFAGTAAARWAAENAAEYGIILRYPLGFDGITGFSAEPWHFRYVGRDVSLAMQDAGTRTLEEHFGLPAAPSY